jgi:hypothetical protein
MPSNYSCNCPDYTKKQTFLINSTSFSHSYTRDWSDTNGGVNPGQYCKHIWSVKLLLGDVKESEIPRDVPVPVPTREEKEGDKERYQPGYRGNSFAPKGGFGVKGFRPYRGGS